jgi:Arc/MetJ-type ribon-helix-helix transcriptional regulator
MDTISRELTNEIDRRLAAGPYTSSDELLRDALHALDKLGDTAQGLLEEVLLKGLEGGDTELTAADWDFIEAEALKVLEA